MLNDPQIDLKSFVKIKKEDEIKEIRNTVEQFAAS